MIKAVFRFIGGVFRFFLRGLDLLRRVVLNLAFLVVIAVLIVLFWLPEPGVPDASVLVLRPSGALVEQTRLESPLKLLDPRGDGGQTALHDLITAVRAATDDERIQALVIETDELSPGGISKLSELRTAIEQFKASGKPVLARGERFVEGQYYLASVADEVHLSPDGFLMLRGLASYSSYFGNALEKLGVKMHVFRVGEYKSFAEPFTRADMSDEDRESTRDLLTGLWNAFIDDIATSRALDPVVLQNYVADFGAVLDGAGGDPARAAVDSALVDQLTTRDEWTALLRSRFGEPANKNDPYRGVSVARYLPTLPESPAGDGRIAVLVAQGAIMDGSGAPGTVGGDAFARLIRDAREDDSVRALVIRIDSPGGSAWASEQIRRELEITREAGKPVIASMSSTAASGGYWIAAGADEIHAHPLTLTGSIGIFALFPDVSEPLSRLGVTNDGVSTGPLAGVPDPRRPLEPQAIALMQTAVEHGYGRFLETVAQSRNMSIAEVDLLARGRVWTGEAANKLDLVDMLGGIHGAIHAAALRAGIEQYEVVWPESRLSPRDLLMRRITGFLGLQTDTSPSAGASSPFGALFTSLQRDFDALLNWNDPRDIYVHCLCEGP